MAATSCRICGGVLKKRFSRVLDPETLEAFAIYGCVNCGLGHTIPQPDNLERYYGTTYHGGRHGFTATYRASRRLRIIKSASSGEDGDKKLLDVGCGDGTFLLAAKADGWTVFGTEMRPQIARSLGLDVVEAIDKLPDADSFDCITLWHSLEHLRDPRTTIIRLAGLLKSEGMLVIAVPDAEGFQARVFGRNWFHLDVPRHLYHFGADSIEQLVDSAGFAVRRQWHQELEYDLLGWSQSALNVLFGAPNGFFRALTGRAGDSSQAARGMTIALGCILSGLSLPALAAGTLFCRGGTLVTMATRK
jgi:SAM-dependent methyltransferase